MTIALPSASEVAAALIAREELPPEKGDIGPEGKAGTNGESIKGERGEKGDSIKGEPGTHGKDGRSMFAGEAHPIAVLGKAGDLYLDTITGAVWRRDTEWREVGNLRGPAAKAAIDGRDGTSISAGAGQPIAPSNEGDLYLETNTGDLYRFDTGAWHVIGNLRGPKGETGATGRGGLFPRPGGGSSGSGLPSGGTVGQVVTNTGPGTGAWDDATGLPPQWTDGGNGDVTATTDAAGKVALTVEQFESVTPVLDLVAIAPASTDGELLLRIIDENGDTVGHWEANGRLFVKNAAWTTFVGLYPDGFLRIDADPATFARQLMVNVNWGATPIFRVYAPGFGYVARYLIYDPGDIGFTIDAQTGQTANLAEVRDDVGTLTFRLDKRGGIVIGVVSAPADGALAASQMALWFDDTNGAASPMWKGKSADGTVVSGSLGGGSSSFLSIAKWT